MIIWVGNVCLTSDNVSFMCNQRGTYFRSAQQTDNTFLNRRRSLRCISRTCCVFDLSCTTSECPLGVSYTSQQRNYFPFIFHVYPSSMIYAQNYKYPINQKLKCCIHFMLQQIFVFNYITYVRNTCTLVFSGVRIAQIFVFVYCFVNHLFLFLLAIQFYVLPFIGF